MNDWMLCIVCIVICGLGAAFGYWIGINLANLVDRLHKEQDEWIWRNR